MSNEETFWDEHDELLELHRRIREEVIEVRLRMEVPKSMFNQENSDYEKFAKLGMELWNNLNEQLQTTTEQDRKEKIIQKMNEIRNAIENINRSRLSLEEGIYSIFK